MPNVVLLDAGPLGMAAHPRPVEEIVTWLARLLAEDVEVLVPAIADYEVRRELLLAGLTKSIRRLDRLKSTLGFLPITSDAMLKATEFWAAARRTGRPTSHEKALDADAILAGQAATFSAKNVIVATANPRHLTRFVAAQHRDKVADPGPRESRPAAQGGVPRKSPLLEPIVCIIMEKLSPYGGSLPSSR
jgi:predicted nucleic acid-binding protein